MRFIMLEIVMRVLGRLWRVVVGGLVVVVMMPATIQAQHRQFYPDTGPDIIVQTALNIGVVSAVAWDVESTRRTIRRGAVEVNPLVRPYVRNTGLLYASGVGRVAGVLWGSEILERHGHRRWSVVLRVVSIGAGVWAASNNGRR